MKENSRVKKSVFKKWHCYFLASILLAAMVVMATGQIIKHYYQNHQNEIALKLKQAFGFPITFEEIDLSLKGALSIKKIIVFDSAVPIPFVEIHRMDFFPDFSVLLKERRLQFKSAIVHGLKIKISVGSSDNISLLGLQGELLSTTVDYAAFMKAINEYDDIKIKYAIIDWVLEKRSIRQGLQGHFQHQRITNETWVFSGTQAIVGQSNKRAIKMKVKAYLASSLASMAATFQLSDEINLQEIDQFYQLAADDPLWLKWIKTAVSKGIINQGSFSLNKQAAMLNWEGSLLFKKADCLYAAGWPSISAAQGKISFNQETVGIELEQGQLMETPIQSATAVVGPLRDLKNLNVTVNGQIESTLEKGRLFLTESPLASSITTSLPLPDLQGQMNLELALTIPLVKKKAASVIVDVTTKGATLNIPETPFSLTAIEGIFRWRDGSLIAKEAKAKFLDRPLSLQIGTVVKASQKLLPKKAFVVTATGKFQSADIQKIAPYPMLNAIQGQALLTVTWFPGEWHIVSDLDGMAVNFPGLIAKKANTRKPISLQINEIKKERKIQVHWENMEAIFSLNLLHPELNAGSIQLLDPAIKGLITLHSAKYKIPSLIEIHLSYLKLAENREKDQALTGLNQIKKPIQFYCEAFQYGKKDFGEIALNLQPKAYGYEIQSLTAEKPDAELSLAGEWHFVNTRPFTTLQGYLKSPNMGNALLEMGYATAIREAKGIIEYELQWLGDPWQVNLKTLTGTADLRFDKGRILGLEPGLGRIMGLLNLQSIQRRLQLDFSDLFKKGFVFDSLRGQLAFKDGIIKTDQLKIDGPASKIELSGQAIAATKAVDLTLTVKPHMGVGLPLAAAIAAGNPAVGAGVWLVDRLTGSKVKKMSQHLYHVTGTWETPSIQPIEPKNN